MDDSKTELGPFRLIAKRPLIVHIIYYINCVKNIVMNLQKEKNWKQESLHLKKYNCNTELFSTKGLLFHQSYRKLINYTSRLQQKPKRMYIVYSGF